MIGDTALSWDGSRIAADPNPQILTYDDHRMAMAFAPAAVCVPGLTILDAAVVSKSYPDYWQHLEQVGFKLNIAK